MTCRLCWLTGGVRSSVEGLRHFPISITHAASLLSSSGFRSEVELRGGQYGQIVSRGSHLALCESLTGLPEVAEKKQTKPFRL